MSDTVQPRKEGNAPHLIPSVGQAHANPNNTGIKLINTTQDDFDEYGAELRRDARVWKTYVKEADKFDAELVDGWNRSLDVTLVFAALFTAICTAFVVESSKSLKEDPTEIVGRRLDRMTDILLVVANLSDSSQINSTNAIASQPFSPRPVDLCVNILWFFSLILSGSVSLLAMLAKEWCYLFMSGRIGDPWSQTKRRQQRWGGIEKWKMEQVIMVLPSFIHLAFLSFAIGLCIYLGDLNWRVAILASIVTFGSIFIYVASTILPLFYLPNTICPYNTSISRLIQHFRKDIGGSEQTFKHTNQIAIEALAWLIKTSEDPNSTDIALQAIAGADPSGVDQQLLKDSGAEIMISKRLMGLDPNSSNYKKLIDLYTRAYSYFHPLRNDKKKPEWVSSEPAYEVMGSFGGYRVSLNERAQKMIRDLRESINQEITAYVASSNHIFRPTLHNIQALRIGSIAASHCLRISLLPYGPGATLQISQLLDSAIGLLEGYGNHTAHLNDQEIQHLMRGTAILLCTFLSCTPDPKSFGARYVLRLLQITRQCENGQKQFRLEYLGLPMLIYALFSRSYPGWIQPSDTAASRFERAIEVIAYYIDSEGCSKLSKISTLMINLGLLELLSDSGESKLDDTDIIAVSDLFTPVVFDDQNHIHTFPENYTYRFPCAVTTTGNIISSERGELLGKETFTLACLTMLNRTRVDQSMQQRPSGDVYTFVIECVLTLPFTGAGVDSRSTALDLMRQFHDPEHPGRMQNLGPVNDLAQSLDRRGIFTKLKSSMELKVARDDTNFTIKLFATGQAWFLIGLAIKSGVAGHKGWRMCLIPFIGDESLWEIPGLEMHWLEALRGTLVERYKEMWDSNSNHHAYFGIVYHLMTTAGADSPPRDMHMLPGTSVEPPRVPLAAFQHEPKESETRTPAVETPPLAIHSKAAQDREPDGTGLSVAAPSEGNPQSDEHELST